MKQQKPLRRRWPVWAVSIVAVSLIPLLVGLLTSGDRFADRSDSQSGTQTSEEEVRQEYYKNEKLIFSVFPDPDLEAGKTFGYLFHFTAPFEELRDRMLSIYAVHIESGQKFTVQQPMKVTEPSSGYPGLQRFAVFSGLPISGKWRYTVELDGREYGDVVLSVKEPTWELSPQFLSGAYWMSGIENKVGFIDSGFVAGKWNKYMWHFWGRQEDLKGNLNVKAVKQGETRVIDVFEAGSLGGKHNGADAHIPSGMSLPEPGRWRLLPYINGKLFPSIVVEVKPAP